MFTGSNPHPRAKRKKTPWQAPSTIILALTAGLLFAVGHHLFYQHLDGRKVLSQDVRILGTNIPPQQLNVAIGTAFAFLVKASLVTAVSTAYLQLLWRSLLRAARGSTLGDLDTAFSGLNNIISLSKVWVWWRSPLLFALAIVAWLIPLSAIMTPATLSIQGANMLPAPSSLQIVPSLAFDSLQFVDDMPSITDDDKDSLRYAYTLPSREVIEVVKAVAATGTILPVTPPSSNASWAIDFDGPALSCSNISEPLRSNILSNIASAMNATSGSSQCMAYGYVSWLEDLPFKSSNGSQYVFNQRIFQGSSMPAVLYLAAFPEAMKVKSRGSSPAACLQTSGSLPEPETDAVMLQCELATSKYHTAFQYVNGIPIINVTSNLQAGAPMQTVSSVNCTTSGSDDGSCDLNTAVMRTLSYQAIMDAFTYLITGYVAASGNESITFIQSQVISTPLAGTKELQFVAKPLLEQGDNTLAKPLQQNILNWANTRNQGLVKTQDHAHALSLPETIQQLFQNATISMMSQTQLLPNVSSAFAPPPVNVTRETYHNVYRYSSTKLWVAYGLAIIFTAIAAILGLVAVAETGASYSSSSNFSSAFRLATGAKLSASVQDEDLDGRDPLPAHLATAKMWPQQSLASHGSLLRPRTQDRDIALERQPTGKSTTSYVSLAESDIGPPAKLWSSP